MTSLDAFVQITNKWQPFAKERKKEIAFYEILKKITSVFYYNFESCLILVS